MTTTTTIMGNLLQQLENNEAVLLMYLADELPPEDRVEVEQMLARDAGMRAELERLRDMSDAMTLALTEADGVGIAPATETASAAKQMAAVRRVSRVMSQQRAAREAAAARDAAAAAAAAPGSASRDRRWILGLPGWSYPFAAAAVILIAWVAYWGFTQGGTGQRESPRLPFADRVDEVTALALIRSLDPEENDREALASSSAAAADDPATGSDLGSLLRAVAQQESSTVGDRQRAPGNE
jgi:hypothetical protein